MDNDLQDLLDNEFPLRDAIQYLNHAAVAPWPRRASEAVCRFARENSEQGCLNYTQWLRVESSLRDQLKRLLNAPSVEDIALLKNTSEGLSIVAHGLDWQEGDNVVISDQEFPSNRIVWESLATFGVQVRKVELSWDNDPEHALLEACDDRTRLLAISSVQYATGLRMDLNGLGQTCREQGILFCVDAIQSLGALPMDVQAIHADFVAADGHKWMLGPEGLAVFYCRTELRDRLTLRQYGWHMVEHAGDYDRKDWEPAHSARRFECGSPNMLGVHGLHASLSLLEDIGMDIVSRLVLEKSQYLTEALQAIPKACIVSPLAEARRSGIVSFRLKVADQARLHQRLTAAGVLCALRAGAVRFSPHFYTSQRTLDVALDLVRNFADGK